MLIGMLQTLYGVPLPSWPQVFALAAGEDPGFLALHGAGAFLAVLAGVFGLPILVQHRSLVLLCGGPMLIAWSGSWTLTVAGGSVTGAGLGMLSVVVNRRILGGFGARGGRGMVGLVNAFSGAGAIGVPLLFVLAGGLPGPIFWAIGVVAALTAALSCNTPNDCNQIPLDGHPRL